MARTRLTVQVRGSVQGVGFRWWVWQQALELGLDGTATNLDDGRVEVVAEGDEEACRDLLARLGDPALAGARPGRVSAVEHRWSPPRGRGDGFDVR